MNKKHLFLSKVYDSVYDFEKMKYKKKYSEPKIYTGGVDVKKWSKLSERQKKIALSKQWYVYFSFRNSETGLLERQTPIKGNANSLKTKEERLEILTILRNNLSLALKEGLFPTNNDNNLSDEENLTIEEAFNYVLKIKKNTLAESSFNNFENRIIRFKKFLIEKGFQNKNISAVTKKDISNYLNIILEKTSPSNRNNNRTDLSSFFSVLVNEDVITQNIVSKIPVLKSSPQKNKAFTEDEVQNIFEYLKENDLWLYYFCAHIYYGLFRNIEVVRIQIKDVKINEQLIHSKTKTGIYYKQIPKILMNEFYNKIDLSVYNKDYFLFTKDNEPSQWLTPVNTKSGKKTTTTETNRRSYWGKRFSKIVKKKFNFSSDHTIYSLRHSAIGKMFLVKLNDYKKDGIPNFEEKALDFIRTITNHKDNKTVKNYLREIGYYKIEDWSDTLK